MWFTLLNSIFCLVPLSAPPAILLESIAAHGGREHFYSMRDVEYRMTVTRPNASRNTWLERYIFENERSYGKSGDLEQYFDGAATRSTSRDPGARWDRKRNYFLFTMPFKFLDSGFRYKSHGIERFNGQQYHVVDATAEQGVGDSTEPFRLFIDVQSKLVSRLLYFEKKTTTKPVPILMVNSYEEISGVQIATTRIHHQTNWSGTLIGKKLIEEKIEAVRFWNGFEPNNLIPSGL
jgi:hypothetical protein